MVYFLKKSTPSKKGLYLQIYVNFYDASTKKKKTLSYKALGYVSELQAKGIEDPVSYYQEEVKKLNASLVDNQTKQIGDSSPCKYVGHFLVKAMFDHLDLDRVMNIMSSNFKSKYKMSDLVRTLVYTQFLNPGSKLHSFEKVIPNIYNATQFSYDQILDGINFIGRDYPKFIELINHGIAHRWKRNYNKVFFDCTNYYFEIDEQDDFRKYGPSKEERHCPILGQALLLDADMIPLDTEFYPGNQSEKPYIRKRIEDMKSRNNVRGRVIQVADKGLNCARNIYAAVIESNDGYIFSKSVHGKSLSNIEKEWVLKEDNDFNKWYEVRNNKGELLYRYKVARSLSSNGKVVDYDEFEYKCKIDLNDEKETKFKVKEKRIVTFNPSLAKKKRHEIQREVEKLQNKLTFKEAIREELGDSSKYVKLKSTTIDGEKVRIATEIDFDKVEEDLKYAGYNILVTSEIDSDPVTIYNTYHRLWRIEESFRIMKTYLEARPVFLQTEESIYGHFIICYYALVIERLIELKLFQDECSPDSIFEFIRDFKVTENFDGSYINNATCSKFINMLKEKLGLSNIGNLYLSRKDLENIMDYEI